MLDKIESAKTEASPEVAAVIEAGAALPVLDLGPFLAGAPGAVDQLVSDVRHIQETLGFYCIINHGIDQALVDDLVEETRALFHLPDREKLRFRAGRHMQGYWPPNTVANIRPGFEEETDRKSSTGGWVFSPHREPDDPKVVAGQPHRAVNQWPDPALSPRFRPLMERYQGEMLALAQKLIPIYARVVGQPADYFDADFVNPEWYTRCNYHAGGGNGMFVNAHSDHSFLTLLPLSRVPGLQVRTPKGDWIDVCFQEGAIVVNTGEWLNRLSNGRLIATPHRVTQPREERISVPFFMDPNDEAWGDPVPGSVPPGETPRFERVQFGEFYGRYIDDLTLPRT